MSTTIPARTTAARRPWLDWRSTLTTALPGIALVAMYAWIGIVQPNAVSYLGLELIFASAVPLIFATVGQMFIIMVGDIDLGMGYYVGFVNAAASIYLAGQPWMAAALFAIGILGYMGMGALVQVRHIPAIIVTLGASFIWLGIGLYIVPVPTGAAPPWLTAISTATPPLVPMPLIEAVVVAVLAYLITILLPYGAVLRGAGSNAQAVERSGWSMTKIRMTAYACAGFFGLLAGLAVTSVTSTGDATASADYTLLGVAGVILGGGQFAGGVAVPFGAVIGAMAISLVGSLLTLLHVPSDFQTGVQGLILVLVLAGRAITRRSSS